MAGLCARTANARTAGACALQPAPPVQEQAGTPIGMRAAGARIAVGAELLGSLEEPGTGESDAGQSRIGGHTAAVSAVKLVPLAYVQAGTPAGVHVAGAATALRTELLIPSRRGLAQGVGMLVGARTGALRQRTVQWSSASCSKRAASGSQGKEEAEWQR